MINSTCHPLILSGPMSRKGIRKYQNHWVAVKIDAIVCFCQLTTFSKTTLGEGRKLMECYIKPDVFLIALGHFMRNGISVVKEFLRTQE